MGWAAARAELVSILNGAQITSPYTETLTALEYPPKGVQGADVHALAFVVPPARTYRPGVNAIRTVEIDSVTVRVLLFDPDAEDASKRMEGWIDKLSDLLDNNLTLNGNLQGSIMDWSTTEFSTYGPDGAPPYGFDLVLSIPLAVVEAVTRGV